MKKFLAAHSPKVSLQKAVAIATLLILPLSFSTAKAETTNTGCTHPFIDVADHWAEEDICFMYEEGIVSGYSEKNFLPNNPITRAEFLKISLLNLSYTVYPVQSASFTDVTAEDWAYSYITFARSKGFVSGYTDGSFHPNDYITRAEAVTMITQMSGIIEYDVFGFESRFSDVSADDWFGDAVAAAVDQGIVEGYGNGTFRPNNNLTRAEAIVIAERVWEELY
ncbi:MAG: S-layer homology domain-containing protein [Patescibacteria group bacterium]